jgi:inorganic pyrophosphatase
VIRSTIAALVQRDALQGLRQRRAWADAATAVILPLPPIALFAIVRQPQMNLPAFADAGAVHVIVESPRGSALKLKYDPDRGVMMLSRPLPEGLTYPHDWGFIPSTQAPDGDPLDVFIMWDGVSYPGIVIPCRPIGLLRVEQTNIKSRARERNDRIAALPIKAPRLDAIRSVFDIPERTRLELQQFFLAAVAFEGKDLKILGWSGPDEAIALVRASS